MKRVLVTGGAGYIGSHTCKVLADNGILPIVFDNLIHGHEYAVRWGPLIVGDINDREALDHAFRIHRPDAVVHFAAFAYVGESVSDPGKYYRNNVVGSISLLESMRAAGIDKIVFSSTCATYGNPKELPISEDTEQWPVNPYGHSKLMVERILRDYGSAYTLRHVALRYFNAAGLDPSGTLVEDHNPETHVIPRILLTAARKFPHFEIFGDDYPTTDGTCVRDYIHVSDLARAHLNALQYLERGEESVSVNLGTGRGISVAELLRRAEQVTGVPVPTITRARRPGDPPELFADCRLAMRLLDWKPIYSDIDTIMRTAWPYFKMARDENAKADSVARNS